MNVLQDLWKIVDNYSSKKSKVTSVLFGEFANSRVDPNFSVQVAKIEH